MELFKSFIALAVLVGLLCITGVVISADGWLAGGVFLLGSMFMLGLLMTFFSAIMRLLRFFTRRPRD